MNFPARMNRRTFHRTLATLAGAAVLPKSFSATSRPNPSTPLTAVDTHAHIFQRSLTFAPNSRYVPDYDATAADFLRLLDAHALSHGVLVQPSFLGTDNSYLLAALREHPDRLRGVVVVAPTIAVSELWGFDAAGVTGIRLNLIGQNLPDFTAAPWPRFLRDLVTLDWFVEVQREARDLPLVVGPLLAAGLKVVVDHFGRPDPALGVDDPGFRFLLKSAASRRLWLKLSGSYRNGADGVGEKIAAAAVPLARDAFGAERLLWGSDWPHTQFERAVRYAAVRAEFDQWITKPTERAAILQTTPAALFRIARNSPAAVAR
jgi:predicted TIM-barrel fold metal-dependent hydrolase